MARICRVVTAGVALVVLLAGVRDVQAQQNRLLFFDPDANHHAIVNITHWFNSYLEAASADATFQPVGDRNSLEALLKEPATHFTIVPASYLRGRRQVTLRPVLVPSSDGDIYYRKLLLAKGPNPLRDFRGKTLAATVSARDGAAARKNALALLKGSDVSFDGALVIPVAKDIDALLALAFGQAYGALATQGSLKALERINPSAVASFETLYKTPQILRSPLCVVGERVSTEELQRFVQILSDMGKAENGRRAMQSLGFDRWVSFTQRMMANQ